MSEHPKYVCIDTPEVGPCCFVFPAFVSHRDFARKFSGEVLSAGFVSINDLGVQTYGESVSLGVKSKKEDAKIIERQYGIEAYEDQPEPGVLNLVAK